MQFASISAQLNLSLSDNFSVHPCVGWMVHNNNNNAVYLGTVERQTPPANSYYKGQTLDKTDYSLPKAKGSQQNKYPVKLGTMSILICVPTLNKPYSEYSK